MKDEEEEIRNKQFKGSSEKFNLSLDLLNLLYQEGLSCFD